MGDKPTGLFFPEGEKGLKPVYENPLVGRYSSKKMQYIFSPDFKFSTWRSLWVALAESEQEQETEIKVKRHTVVEIKSRNNNQ